MCEVEGKACIPANLILVILHGECLDLVEDTSKDGRSRFEQSPEMRVAYDTLLPQVVDFFDGLAKFFVNVVEQNFGMV